MEGLKCLEFIIPNPFAHVFKYVAFHFYAYDAYILGTEARFGAFPVMLGGVCLTCSG